MKKSFLSVFFVVLVIGLMFSLSSCQKKQAEEAGEQPGVEESADTGAAEPEAEAAPEMTPAPEEAPEVEGEPTDTAEPGSEVPAPPAGDETE